MKIYNWELCPWSDTEFLWHLEVIFMVPISEASGMCSDNMQANKGSTVRMHFGFYLVKVFFRSNQLNLEETFLSFELSITIV